MKFKSTPTIGIGEESRIDRENAVIYGASLIQGNVTALGHGVFADEIALGMFTALGNGATGGLKSHYGHANASETALGTQIATIHNLRLSADGEKTIGDMRFLQSARISPNFGGADVVEYILAMAEEAPQHFAHSVVFSADAMWRMEDGREIRAHDEYGDPTERPEGAIDEIPVIRPLEFYASDVVDDPAANRDGLFSANWAAVDGMADKYTKEIDAFLLDSGFSVDKAYQFMSRYFYSKGLTKRKDDMDLKSIFSKAKESGMETAVDGVDVETAVEATASQQDVESVEGVDVEETAVEEDENDDGEETAVGEQLVEDGDWNYVPVEEFEATMAELATEIATMIEDVRTSLSQLSAEASANTSAAIEELSARIDGFDRVNKLRKARPTASATTALGILKGITPDADPSVDGRTTYAKQAPVEAPEDGVRVNKSNGGRYPKRG